MPSVRSRTSVTSHRCLIDFENILRSPLPAIPWLVHGLLAQADRMVLFAEWGAMKTWTLLHLGLHLAAGRTWLDKFPIARPLRVLYLDEEMARWELQRRLKQLALGADIEGDIPFRALSRAGFRFDAEGAGQVRAILGEFDPEVVIVDSMRRVLAGSENDAHAVGDFWRVVTDLGQERTFIFAHHMSKASPGRRRPLRDRASGSTDVMAGSDNAVALVRLEPEVIAIEPEKMRHAKEAGAFLVNFEFDGEDGPVRLRYAGPRPDRQGGRRAGPTKRQRAAEAAQAFLATQPGVEAKKGTIQAHLGKQGIGSRTVDEAIRDLAQSGVVAHGRGFGWWRLVEVGS